MKRELDSFVYLFEKYFPNLFRKKSLCGKFYHKMCVLYYLALFKTSHRCTKAFEKGVFKPALYLMKVLMLSYRNS